MYRIVTKDDPEFTTLREQRNRLLKPDATAFWGDATDRPFVDE